MRLAGRQASARRLTRCHALNTTTRVREAFLSHQVALPAVKQVFPGQWAYTLEQVDFARQCQELIGRGERAVQEALRCVAALQDGDGPAGNAGVLSSGRADARHADGGEDVSAQKHRQVPPPAHRRPPGIRSRRAPRKHAAVHRLCARSAPARKLSAVCVFLHAASFVLLDKWRLFFSALRINTFAEDCAIISLFFFRAGGSTRRKGLCHKRIPASRSRLNSGKAG